MSGANAVPSNQVLRTEGGKVIAFWRGKLVLKLDGAVRYFGTEHEAEGFLARRDTFGNGGPGAPRPHTAHRPADIRKNAVLSKH